VKISRSSSPTGEANVGPDGEAKNEAAGDVFSFGAHGQKGHAIEEGGHDQRSKKNPTDGASSASQAGPADDAGGNGVQFHQTADGGRARSGIGGYEAPNQDLLDWMIDYCNRKQLNLAWWEHKKLKLRGTKQWVRAMKYTHSGP
jgi:hypothetical protein